MSERDGCIYTLHYWLRQRCFEQSEFSPSWMRLGAFTLPAVLIPDVSKAHEVTQCKGRRRDTLQTRLLCVVIIALTELLHVIAAERWCFQLSRFEFHTIYNTISPPQKPATFDLMIRANRWMIDPLLRPHHHRSTCIIWGGIRSVRPPLVIPLH